MKIKRMSVFAIKIPLTETFATSLGKSDYYQGVIVKLITDSGLAGYGAGTPSPRITGTTLETTMGAFYRLAPLVLGKEVFDFRSIVLSMKRSLIGNAPAKAAIEIALYDLLGKAVNRNIVELMGSTKKVFPTSVTISLSNKSKMVSKARYLVERGIKILKIKIGLGVEEDVNILKMIRQEVGDEIELRIDANQAYTPKKAVKLLKQIENLNIELCEQPVYWRDIDGLRYVKNNTEIPIMADESVHDARDAIELIKRDAVDMINIKIMKTGGLIEAQKIAEICSSAGIKCQIGCMSESAISLAPALALAISMEGISYADLDGHLLLKEDVAVGLRFRDGNLYLSDKPGLGLLVDENVIDKYVVARLTFGD